MAKISYYIGQSLDGYIADINGKIDWMDIGESSEELLKQYSEFIKNVDICIMGYTTYEQLVNELSPSEWPHEEQLTYVITNRNIANTHNIIFTNDIDKIVKDNSNANIWLVGGANLGKQFIEKNLIDEYIITTIPVCIGQGIRLFDNVKVSKLKISKIEQIGNYITTTYKVK